VYSGSVPIKAERVADVAKVVHCIPEEHQVFFETLLSWPTAIGRADDSE
jgi:hypothetical protein